MTKGWIQLLLGKWPIFVRILVVSLLPVSRPGVPLAIIAIVSAWRDEAEAKLHGEVFRRFIRGWLQTDVDRRRIQGV